MGASSSSVGWPLNPPEIRRDARAWIDALCSGSCGEDEFVQAVLALDATTPDTSWDALALLDQSCRLGKIEAGQFLALKNRLSRQLLPSGPDTRPAAALQKVVGAVGDAIRESPVPTPSSRVDAKPPVAPAEAGTIPVIGDVLRGRYRLQAVLGRSARGTLFEALDQYRTGLPTLSQRVAIKVLHGKAAQRPHELTNLYRAFQVAQSLSHPCIARVYEFDRDGDLAYFTRELLDGLPLSKVLGERNGTPLDRAHALAIVRDIASALAYAHSRGVVHGDLNPRNVFITHDGEIRLLAFGPAASGVSEAVVGQHYASVQVLQGEVPEARDDTFSLSCLAYELLTGQHPFHHGTALSARALRLSVPRPAGLTRRTWQMLRAGLQWERNRRPADMQSWLGSRDLDKAAARLPVPASLLHPVEPPRRFVPVVVGSAGIVVLVAAALWATQAQFWMRSEVHPVAASAFPPAAPLTAEPATLPPEPPRVTTPTSRIAANARLPGETVGPPESGMREPTLEMTDEAYDVPESDPVARITVRRSGNLKGDLRFAWWTEEDSAKAGVDFVPFGHRIEQFMDGQDSVTLLISIVPDPARLAPKRFYVSIADAGDGLALGPLTRTRVTIPAVN